jgi:hypothetical protein
MGPQSERELYEELPSDPEEAFLVLEEHFRDQCNQALAHV